jgi:ABC-type glycerol-3-phosphate transport system substrate-binding protein
MGDKQKLFQYALLIIFGAITLVAVGMLALFKPSEDPGATVVAGPTVIWGPPLQGGGVSRVLQTLRSDNERFKLTTYVEKNPATLYSDLLEALAVGRGPDAVVIEPSMLLALRDKIQPYPYTHFTARQYRDTYVEGAEIFALDDGIYAFPFLVDPMVLYWNRNLFNNADIVTVPQDWTAFTEIVPRLSILRGGNELIQSGVAFGEYNNVRHSKEILSALFMQLGLSLVKPVTGISNWGTDLMATHRTETAGRPELALRFYTDFADPIKTVYSWNKTFDSSREAFAANRVAMYAGFAGELETVIATNPNLNFDIAMLPQATALGRNRLTYGKFYGIAVLKQSNFRNDAYSVALELSSSRSAETWQKVTNLPTVRRDMLRADPSDPYSTVVTQSALIARSWLEPDQRSVNDVFSRMVNDVVAKQSTVEKAVTEAGRDIGTLLNRYNR